MTSSSQPEPFYHSPIGISSQTLQSSPPEPSVSVPGGGLDSGIVSYPQSGTLNIRSEYVDATTLNLGELLREIQRLGQQLTLYEQNTTAYVPGETSVFSSQTSASPGITLSLGETRREIQRLEQQLALYRQNTTTYMPGETSVFSI